MSEPQFIILENGDDLDRQISAIRDALPHLEKPGDIVGVRVFRGAAYGVRRNRNSVRVYRQPDSDE